MYAGEPDGMIRGLRGMIRFASCDQAPHEKRTQRRDNLKSMTQSDATSDLRRRQREHASLASKNSASCVNERTTESFLVIPFIRFLGYNPHDPNEVHPQFDTAPEGGEKAPVDFAIFRELKGEPKPFVLVEAKAFNRTIGQDEVDQLKGYLGATTATFGLLTDGNVCHWYKRPPGKNFMDDRPFLTHSILDPSDDEIEWLSAVSNGAMERGDIERLAWRMSLENEIRKWLVLTFKTPGDPAAINKAANLGVPKRDHEIVLEAAKSVWSSMQSERPPNPPPPLPPPSEIELVVVQDAQVVLADGEVLAPEKTRKRAWRIGTGQWRKADDASDLVVSVLSQLLGCDLRRNDEERLAQEIGLDSFDSRPADRRYTPIGGFASLYCNTGISNSQKGKLLRRLASKIDIDPSVDTAVSRGARIECWLPTGGRRERKKQG